jgi:Polyketide cyclase / dehydrase and lipid transport
MASIRKEIETKARPDDVWAAIADIGALHTRLVPGFVVDTKLEPGARVVTFDNGMVVREPIVTIDGASRRLVWTAEGVERRTTMRRSRCFRRPTERRPLSGSPTSCPTRWRALSPRRWRPA